MKRAAINIDGRAGAAPPKSVKRLASDIERLFKAAAKYHINDSVLDQALRILGDTARTHAGTENVSISNSSFQG